MSYFPIIELDSDQFEIVRVKDLNRLLFLHTKQSLVNHGKTVMQMEHEGGLGWIEVLAILQDRPVDVNDSESDAKTMVLGMLAEYQQKLIDQERADRLEAERRIEEDRREAKRKKSLRPRFLEVSAHCSDLCDVALLSEQRETIAERDGYVPCGLGIGGGDDVTLTIDLDTGMIVGWKRPTDKALKRFIERGDEEDDDEDEDWTDEEAC